MRSVASRKPTHAKRKKFLRVKKAPMGAAKNNVCGRHVTEGVQSAAVGIFFLEQLGTIVHCISPASGRKISFAFVAGELSGSGLVRWE